MYDPLTTLWIGMMVKLISSDLHWFDPSRVVYIPVLVKILHSHQLRHHPWNWLTKKDIYRTSRHTLIYIERSEVDINITHTSSDSASLSALFPSSCSTNGCEDEFASRTSSCRCFMCDSRGRSGSPIIGDVDDKFVSGTSSSFSCTASICDSRRRRDSHVEGDGDGGLFVGFDFILFRSSSILVTILRIWLSCSLSAPSESPVCKYWPLEHTKETNSLFTEGPYMLLIFRVRDIHHHVDTVKLKVTPWKLLIHQKHTNIPLILLRWFPRHASGPHIWSGKRSEISYSYLSHTSTLIST